MKQVGDVRCRARLHSYFTLMCDLNNNQDDDPCNVGLKVICCWVTHQSEVGIYMDVHGGGHQLVSVLFQHLTLFLLKELFSCLYTSKRWIMIELWLLGSCCLYSQILGQNYMTCLDFNSDDKLSWTKNVWSLSCSEAELPVFVLWRVPVAKHYNESKQSYIWKQMEQGSLRSVEGIYPEILCACPRV